YFVAGAQINAQLPWESAPANGVSGTVNIVVTTTAGSSTAQTVNVLPAVPGIFTVTETGIGQAIATDSFDNQVLAPPGSVHGLTTHAYSIASATANPPHAIVLWCTGLGAVNPPMADGANSFNPDNTFTLRNTVMQPTVTVGGVQAKVISSVLSPQFVS